MKLPEIIAYHPEIQIEKEGARHVLKLTVGDFAEDGKILKSLAEDLGVQTVGEIVQAIDQKKIQTASVEHDVVIKTSAGKVWDWSDKVS